MILIINILMMKAFKRRLLFSMIFLTIVQVSMGQTFGIYGPACALPNVPYTYNFYGSYPTNPVLHTFTNGGGTIVGYTTYSVTVVWSGNLQQSALYCYYGATAASCNVTVAQSWTNTINLTGLSISNNMITSLSATSAAPMVYPCSFRYLWTNAKDDGYFSYAGETNSLNLANAGNTATLRLQISVIGDDAHIWYSDILSVKASTAYAGYDAGMLSPSPMATCSGVSYTWYQSDDGTTWTMIQNYNSRTYRPGILNATRWFKTETFCDSRKSTTLFKVTVRQPTTPIVTEAGTAVPAGGLPGTIVVQPPANSINCDTYSFQWEQSFDGVNFEPIMGAENAVYSPDYLFGTTWYRRRTNCPGTDVYSAVVKCSAIKPLTGGTVNPKSAVVTSEGSLNFSSVLPAAGGNGVDPVIYQWQKSDDGTSFADITGATGADYYALDVDKTTYFRRKVVCANETAYSNTTQAIRLNEDNYNYVQELVAVKPGMPDNLEVYADDLQQVQQTTMYFDGLGRPIQTVARNQSLVSGLTPKDLVAFNQYDAMGREAYGYLPFASTTANGLIKLPALVQQKEFFNQQLAAEPAEVNIGPSAENWAFSKINFEASPLSRVTETFEPGVNWVGTSAQTLDDNRKSTKAKYLTNQPLDGVRIWNITNVAGDYSSYTSPGTYEPGTLIKTSTVDEQGAQTISYKDLDGLLILKKIQHTAAKDDGSGSNYTGWLCTYYVYDNLQQLRAVIQPNAVKVMADANNWTLDQTMLSEQCFRYEYDDHQRMNRRKTPGSGEETLVYDALDRPVLTQHANQRSQHKWIFNKYDAQGRLVMTGSYIDHTHISQSDMQAYVDNQNYALYELPSAVFPFYTISRSFPAFGIDQTFTIDYYDNYDFTSAFATEFRTKDNIFDNLFSTNASAHPYPAPMAQSTATKGKLTGHWERTGTGTLRVKFYNDEGLVIQTRSINNLGGTDVRTTQYGYTGMLLQEHFQSEKKGINPQNVTTFTRYSYDNLGRVTEMAKKMGSSLINNGVLPNDYTVIAEMNYDAMGSVRSRKIGRQKDDQGNYLPNELESQTFDYNIRGWLLGLNRNYLATNSGQHFGFELAYDKQTSQMNNNAANVYASRLLNGNINGMIWRSTGDGEIRKFDYSYDVAGRLTGADFNQYTNNGFNKNAKVDFTVSNLQYDNNGNIQSVRQMGLKGPQSAVVDDLTYTYFTGSNRLKNVRDASNDATSKLGDFKTSPAHPQKTDKEAASTQALRDQITDYDYDNNGNLIKDYNKDIGDANTQGITYNYLNLPELITFKKAGATSPSTIAYTYDESGMKLKKVVTDNTGSTPVVTTTLYGEGTLYVNDVLQFIGHEQGRTRFKPAAGTALPQLNYDYFLKDHLGNIRMVLTEEHDQCIYPAATLEGSGSASGVPNALFKEKEYYDINEGNIVDKPDQAISYENNNGIYNNNPYSDAGATTQKMYQLQASGGVAATGLGMVLKVMSGDKIDIFGKSYYNMDNSAQQNYQLPVLDLLTGFLGGPAGLGATKGITPGSLNSISNIAGKVGDFLNDPGRGDNTDNKPKAYINYILFDNQFNYVSGGFSRVDKLGEVKDHFIIDPSTLHDVPVVKNGYIYVYCSNESPVKVYFDNLQVVHTRGALLEETHYYPFGLAMSGISDKAVKPGYFENNYKFNDGTELQQHEFADGSGLDLYATDFRSYDAQLGRFHQIDPIAGFTYEASPYSFANNNPINFGDPSGLQADTAAKGVKEMPAVTVVGYKKGECKTCSPKSTSAPAAEADPEPEPEPAPSPKPAPPAPKPAPAAPKPKPTPTPAPAKPAPSPASMNEGDIAATYPKHDSRSYLRDANHPKPYEVDCSMFASEVAVRAGYNLMRGKATDQANWYKKNGTWSTKLSDAQKGDHIFWSRGKGNYHTGIVSDVRVVGKNRMITVVQSQTAGYKPYSIKSQPLMPNGEISGFNQPFVGVGRYP
jgi:RHS repeat-associated protein